MKLHQNLFILCLAICSIVALSVSKGKLEKYHLYVSNYADGPPTSNTGAPGVPNEGSCIQCHTGTVQSAFGNVDVSFSNQSNEYTAGQTYDFTIGKANNLYNGFELTILNSFNNYAGTLISGTNSEVLLNNGRGYVRQTSVADYWTFSWTAPPQNMGTLTAYYTFNESNNDGTSNGDVIYLGQHVLSPSSANTISAYEKQDNKIRMFFNENSEELRVTYSLLKKSNLQLNVSTLSGKLIEVLDLGSKSFGLHSDIIKLNNINYGGVYIVSLFVNNNVFNRKIYLK